MLHAPALSMNSWIFEVPHEIHYLSEGLTTSPNPHSTHVPSIETSFLSATLHVLSVQVLVSVSSSYSPHGSHVPLVLNLCLSSVHVGSEQVNLSAVEAV